MRLALVARGGLEDPPIGGRVKLSYVTYLSWYWCSLLSWRGGWMGEWVGVWLWRILKLRLTTAKVEAELGNNPPDHRFQKLGSWNLTGVLWVYRGSLEGA